MLSGDPCKAAPQRASSERDTPRQHIHATQADEAIHRHEVARHLERLRPLILEARMS